MFDLNVNINTNLHFHFHFHGDLPALPKQQGEILERFQSLIAAHRLTACHLVRLTPEEWGWSALTVTDPKEFLGSISARQLEWFSETFGVRRQWLEGADPIVAHSLAGDSYPEMLHRDLNNLGWLDDDLRMSVFADKGTFEKGRLPSTYTLVASYPIVKWDNEETIIYKHAVVGTLWDNSDPGCYRSSQVIARWFGRHHHYWGHFPIVPIPTDALRLVSKLKVSPALFFTQHYGGYDCLADHVSVPLDQPNGESARAIPNRSLPMILEYVQKCGLHELPPRGDSARLRA